MTRDNEPTGHHDVRARPHERPADRAGASGPDRPSATRSVGPAVGAAAVAGGDVAALGADDLVALQRHVGNAVLQRALEDGRSPVLDVVGRGGGSPLVPDVRADMEARLGADFSDVRVHTGGTASSSAAAVGAHAYTVGRDVVFGAGKFDTASTAGRTMLAHELTHVVQQRSGPVSGTPTGDGVSISDPDDRFEREAAATAVRVMRTPGADLGSARRLPLHRPSWSSMDVATATVQRSVYLRSEARGEFTVLKEVPDGLAPTVKEVIEGWVNSTGVFVFVGKEALVKEATLEAGRRIASASTPPPHAAAGPPAGPPPPPPPPTAPAPTPGLVSVSEGDRMKAEAQFKKAADKGRERYGRIQTSLRVSGHADAEVAHGAANMLDAASTHEELIGRKSMKTNLGGTAGGVYENEFSEGQIFAMSNSHAKGNDPALMSALGNSEILFLQYRRNFPTAALKKLLRVNVASASGLEVFNHLMWSCGVLDSAVITASPEGIEPGEGAGKPPADLFFALLGTENGIAAMGLLLDHRNDLKINGLATVTLRLKERIIEFTYIEQGK